MTTPKSQFSEKLKNLLKNHLPEYTDIGRKPDWGKETEVCSKEACWVTKGHVPVGQLPNTCVVLVMMF